MGVLEGKAAVVTGSARGIGRAAAELLAAHGARVLMTDLDEETRRGDGDCDRRRDRGLRRRPDEGRRPGGDRAARDRRVRAAGHRRQQRRLHVGRHGAQDERRAVSRDARDPHRRPVQAAPRRGAVSCAMPARRTRKRVARCSARWSTSRSISGTQGNLGQANYSTAKAGLIGLTKTLAREWGPFKVNVNAVAFGFVETRLTAASDDGGESFVKDGVEIPLGIPEKMRQMAPIDHSARPTGDARGRGRADLLPLLAVVELRPRPGAHRERRSDDRHDVVRPRRAPRRLNTIREPDITGHPRDAKPHRAHRSRRAGSVSRGATRVHRRCARPDPRSNKERSDEESARPLGRPHWRWRC